MKLAIKDFFFFVGLWFIGRASMDLQAQLMERRAARINKFCGVEKPIK